MKGKRIKINKILAILLLTILILNNCINIFGIFKSSVFAANTDVVLKLEDTGGIIKDATKIDMEAMDFNAPNGKYIEINVNVNNISLRGLDISLKYDSNKIIPSYIADRTIPDVNQMNSNDPLPTGNLTDTMVYFNKDTGLKLSTLSKLNTDDTIRLVTTLDSGGSAYNSSGKTTTIIKLYFRLVDESLTAEELVQDILKLQPAGSLATGIMLEYGDLTTSTDASTIFSYEGFAEEQKTISSIEITTLPKTVYNHGETIDVSGGVITINYSDGNPSETINMSAEGVSISPTIARIDNTEVIVSYKGFIDTYDITVNNSVKSIEIETPPTKTNYYINETLTLDGGTLKIIYADDTTETLPLDEDWIRQPVPDLTTTGDKTIIIQYPNTTFTASIPIKVRDKVLSFEIDPEDSPETEYFVGESFEAGGRILVTYESGTIRPVSIDETMLEGFNTTQVATNLPVEIVFTDDYGNKIRNNVTYAINVTKRPSDAQDALTIIEQPVTSYKYGEEFKPGGKIQLKYADDTFSDPIDITQDMLTGFTTSETGTHTVTINYAGKTVTYPITVRSYAVSIEITAPTTTQYKYGDPLNFAGGEIRITYVHDTQNPVLRPITSNMITPAYNPNQLGTQNLVITYSEEGETDNITESVPYHVNVRNWVKDIELVKPTDTTYDYGDPINLSGGSITLINADNTRGEIIPLTDSRVDVTDESYNPNQPGTQTIRVTYTTDEGDDITETFTITVVDVIESVVITNPEKEDYLYGEDLDLTTGSISVNYRSIENPVVMDITPNMISGYNKNQIGDQTVTITFTSPIDGVTTYTNQTPFVVTVSDYIDRIQVTAPTKTEYELGEDVELDLAGGKVWHIMASGTEGEKVDLTQEMIQTEFNPNVEGTQPITVRYEGKETTFNVEVVDSSAQVRDIYISKNPDKTEYNHGQTISLDGGQITIEYTNREPKVVDMTTDNITFLNGNTADRDKSIDGIQTVQIKYKNYTIEPEPLSFEITIKNDIESIRISNMPKTEYGIGESLNVTGGMLEVTYEDGTTREVPMTTDMVTGFDSSQVTDSQTLTVTYEENGVTKQTSYNISVQDLTNDIESIRISRMPKTEYAIGENLDVTGGMLEITYEDGTTREVPMTTDMVTGFNSSQITDRQTLTVTYTENEVTLETSYNISVQDLANTIDTVEIFSYPDKMHYTHGEEIDLTGGVIKVTYKNGREEYVDMTSEEITLLTPTADAQTNRVRFSYKNNNYAFDLNGVDNPVMSIEMKDIPKTEYLVGEALDITNGSILVTYADGSTKEVDLTSEMVSGFDSSVARQELELTVTYTENSVTKYTNYTVNVKKPVLKSNLNIIKYVSVINNQVVTENIPRLERVNGQVKYVVNSNKLEVEKGDEITFNIRIYNTGNMAEYVESIMETLPAHLEFIEDNDINIRNGWGLVGGNSVKTTVLSRQNDVDGTNIIEAYDAEDIEPPYKELQLVLKVISEGSGSSTTVIEQTSNTQGEETKSEETETDVVVKVVTYDLKVDNYITKVTQLNTYNGDSVAKDIAKTDGVTKIELYRNDVEYTKLLVEYTIDVTNTGTGTTTLDKLVNQIPEGLTFVSDMNPDWTLNGPTAANARLSTATAVLGETSNGTTAVNTSLANATLAPGQTISTKIILQWQGEDNLGSITNKVAISAENDSLSANDEESAVLLVSIVTAGAMTYMMLAVAVVSVFGSGVYLIKKFII